ESGLLCDICRSGATAHWVWFGVARTLPVVLSSRSPRPVPVVGVFSGVYFLGERPGASEFVALALVLASLAAVMFPERKRGAARGRKGPRAPTKARGQAADPPCPEKNAPGGPPPSPPPPARPPPPAPPRATHNATFPH